MTDCAVFISTAIPYVNGPPHVGFAWELVIADVLARYHRARGRSVCLLTGTDDNSLKNVRAAEAEGTPTADFVHARGQRFAGLCQALGISHDDFIRTAFDPRHAPAVERIWRACEQAGDIYRASYSGRYCVGCEQFYAAHELPGGRCPEHDAPLESLDEHNYFFRLSRHQPGLAGLLEGGSLRILPEVYRPESEGWLHAGLEDFSISRSRERSRGWGVPVPDDPEQIVYVWFDALVNYVSALGYGSAAPGFVAGWQQASRRIHVIGKNVTRFHCIYWPAILASAGVAPPSDVVVHGFLTVEGRKIGKSLGNGVDPFQLIERWGNERLRYYLLRQFGLGRDGDFSEAALARSCDEELADQLGNLLNRVLVLLEQNTGGVVPERASEAGALELLARAAAERAAAELERCDPHAAIGTVFGFVRAANLELSLREPWKLARRARETGSGGERAALGAELTQVLADAAQALAWAAGLLEPFLPEAAARIAAALGTPLPPVYRPQPLPWNELCGGARVARGDVLFQRVSA